jgi:hypothetical protein
MEVVESLPGNPGSAVKPFVSLVVNLNVRTEAHRDSMDKDLCLVLPIGTFTGGALVLMEPGISLELSNGDFAVFRSSQITHFNLDYEGLRASFAFSTDREFDKWLLNRNMWQQNNMLN